MNSISDMWAGARWWKFDFHAHTPASDDFDDEEKNKTPKEWLLEFMQKEVDCVAVTDHNSADWIGELQTELAKMENDHPLGYRKLVLFPGMEVTTSEGGHILAIFPPNTQREYLLQFLGLLNEKSKTVNPTILTKNAVDVIQIIYNKGGLAIPAHLDDLEGASIINKCKDALARKILTDEGDILSAVELMEDSWPDNNNFKKLVNKMCRVWGSDCHALKMIGRRYTWIKMEKPTFEGLKLALRDQASLSYREINPNQITHPTIERIEVDKAKYFGVHKTFSCVFNPWMNAIIGGRGTGKSTLLEFIRVSLGNKKQNTAFSNTANDGGLMTQNTKITIYFRKDEVQFRSTWTYGTNEIKIEKKTTDRWEKADGVVNERFPIHIRSQKEIFEMATNPKKLMEMVDNAPDVRYAEWNRKREELEEKYLQQCAKIREKKKLVDEKQSVRGRLDDIIQKISLYEKLEKNTTISKYNTCILEKKAIDTWSSNLTLWNDKIKEFPVSSIPQLQSDDFTEDIHEHKLLLEAVTNLKTKINEGFEKIKEGRECITEAVDEWKKAWPFHPEYTRIQSAKGAYEEYKAELGEDAEIIGNTEMWNKCQDERHKLEKKLKEIDTAEEELKSLEETREMTFSKIINHRKNLTNNRKEYLKNLKSSMTQNIRMHIIPFGDKESAFAGFRKMLQIKGENTFSSTIGSQFNEGKEEGILSKLYSSNSRPIDEKKLQNVKKAVLKLRNNEQYNLPYEKLFQAHLMKLKEEDIDRLQCWFPEDYLDISFKTPRQKQWVPLSSGSPGQKSAVLLMLILSQGTEPLILDQPEDDLDNKLIYNMVVEQLRNIKKSRQVIVVTHNANIVINGCAEYVIPLVIEEEETQCGSAGCLHEEQVRDEVCLILEGGREALKQRYQQMIGTVQ